MKYKIFRWALDLLAVLAVAWSYGYLRILARGSLVLGPFMVVEEGVPLVFLAIALFTAHRVQDDPPEGSNKIDWHQLRWHEGAVLIAAALTFNRVLSMLTGEIRLNRDFDTVLMRLFDQRDFGESFVFLGAIPSPELVPLILLVGMVPIAAGLGLARWLGSSARAPAPRADTHPTDIAALASSIILSNEFIQGLRAAIPQTDGDERNGLAGLPWLLAAVVERQKRFRRSAYLFLSITVGLGVVLLAILLGLGFVLVNDDATGLGRRVAGLSNVARSVESSLDFLERGERETSKWTDDTTALLREALNFVREADSSQELKTEFETNAAKILDKEKRVAAGEAHKIAEGLIASAALAKWPKKEELARAFEKLDDLDGQKRYEIDRIGDEATELQRQIDDLGQRLAQPESRIPDLIKRIAVGFLVVSFMAAVLGYSIRLYQQHLAQVIAAERDEQRARLYLVTYQGALDNVDLRRAVLTSFMDGPRDTAGAAGDVPSSKEPSPEASLVRELLKVLQSKAGS